ncbi:MAG TPA: IS110 family transposase [Gemmatimonadaceae bacterium]|jgi:transposase|nr:IS110 family transposase [Gemmatimonadaceae bacterium]
MLTVTTRREREATSQERAPLYLSFELGEREWKLAFATGLGARPRHRTLRARDLERLDAEIALAKDRLQLAESTQVVSCYEAGREGFWLHRALVARRIANVVVDAASIEVNRRLRRAKADRLDNEKLVEMLMRFHAGERRVWHVVTVPSEVDEDRRHLERERGTLIQEQTRLRNRLQGLLANQGVMVRLRGDVIAALRRVRRWDGSALPPQCLARCAHEWARLARVGEALRALERERRQAMAADDDAACISRKLTQLRAVGRTLAWVWATELFAWRGFRNRRQVGSLLGLTPTPSQSGDTRRELGIAKHGNARLRSLAVESAWFWLRYQPQSALSRWYQRRFGAGGPRLRRIGIVALARKLLVALWRWVAFDQLPEGAMLKA